MSYPLPQDGGRMKEQLEITFEAPTQWRRPVRGQERRAKAQWWFTQMRQLVDAAFDWTAPTAPRPEQTYFRLEKRRR